MAESNNKDRDRAENLFMALSGVDADLLARSEGAAQESSKKVIPFMRYSSVAAACVAVVFLGVVAVSVGVPHGGKDAVQSTAPAEANQENFVSASKSETATDDAATTTTVEMVEEAMEEEEDCVAAADADLEETLNLEEYANVTMQVQNKWIEWIAGSEEVREISLEEARQIEGLNRYIPASFPDGFRVERVVAFTDPESGRENSLRMLCTRDECVMIVGIDKLYAESREDTLEAWQEEYDLISEVDADQEKILEFFAQGNENGEASDELLGVVYEDAMISAYSNTGCGEIAGESIWQWMQLLYE